MIDAVAEWRLIEVARAGDHDAFQRLAAPLLPEIRARCRRMLGSPEDGDDVLQETLLRAWLALPSFRGRSSFKGWLYAIATNTSLNAIDARRRRREDALTEDSAPATGESGPAERYERAERLEHAFLAAVRCLSARQRAVLILREVLGWSGNEVAEALGTSREAVNSALQRAREALAAASHDSGASEPIGDLEQALLCGYLRAWTETDVRKLATLARSDAVRTTLMQQLRPQGGGWLRIQGDPAQAQFFPVFSDASR